MSEYHYFANHAIGWATGDTEDEAIEKLLLTNTDPKWNNNCLKDGVFLTLFVCRVPLAETAQYSIEWYRPVVEGLTECKNYVVTYLTKTKYAVTRDLHDTIKTLSGLVRDGLTIHDELMKNIATCAVQDYALLNQFPIDCREAGIELDPLIMHPVTDKS